MKKFFALLPVIGLILGVIIIAIEINTDSSLSIDERPNISQTDCVALALNKRETAIFSGALAYQDAHIALLDTRKSSLLAVRKHPMSPEIKSLIVSIWKTYTFMKKTLDARFDAVKALAWSTYQSDIRACNASDFVRDVDPSSLNNE